MGGADSERCLRITYKYPNRYVTHFGRYANIKPNPQVSHQKYNKMTYNRVSDVDHPMGIR